MEGDGGDESVWMETSRHKNKPTTKQVRGRREKNKKRGS
jgi:hypothetical protein